MKSPSWQGLPSPGEEACCSSFIWSRTWSICNGNVVHLAKLGSFQYFIVDDELFFSDDGFRGLLAFFEDSTDAPPPALYVGRPIAVAGRVPEEAGAAIANLLLPLDAGKVLFANGRMGERRALLRASVALANVVHADVSWRKFGLGLLFQIWIWPLLNR